MSAIIFPQQNKVDQSHPDYIAYRGHLLLQKCRNSLNKNGQSIYPDEFANYIIKQHIIENPVAPPTWTLYKKYSLHVLRSQDESQERERAIEILEAQGAPKSGGINRTKDKGISEAKLITLTAELTKSSGRADSKYAELASLWLKATILTGLRPQEWKNARIDDTNPFSNSRQLTNRLVIKNAKNTNNRSFGETRTLHLTYLSDDDFKTLVRFLNSFNSAIRAEGYDKIFEGVRHQLMRTSKALWKGTRSISLYSARHEFKTRVQEFLPPTLVAALMGHRKIASGNAYGKKTSGKRQSYQVSNSLNIVIPDQLDIARVMGYNQASRAQNSTVQNPGLRKP